MGLQDSPNSEKDSGTGNPALAPLNVPHSFAPYLSLLLLPGRVEQQVTIPVLLLGHVVLSCHVWVVVLDVRFYLRRHVPSVLNTPFSMCLFCSPLATQSPVLFLTLSPLLFCSLPSAPLGGQDPPVLSGCACLLCSCTCQNQPTWPVLNKYYQPWEGGSGSILKRPRGGDRTNVPTNQMGVKTAASKPRIPL